MKDEKARPADLKNRTKQFALRVIRVYCSLPRTGAPHILGGQLLRAGTSVGAHYREGIRSRSDAEFVSKIEGALQELEESGYWLELLVEGGIVPQRRLANLMGEVDELLAILTTCAKRAKARMK